MKEIVAAMIGTIITTQPRQIMSAIELGLVKEFIDRDRMKFMAAFDLGPQWERLAKAPTLFIVDDNGEPQSRNFNAAIAKGE